MRFLARPKGFAEPRPRNAPLGRFCPAGRKARGTGCSNPLFYCSIKSMQNKKSSTPSGAALGATGRIRTSGLPGRRTTTGRYRLALERKLCWFCTVASKTRKSPLLVVTIGFSDILQHHCTVVVKWWSIAKRHFSQASGLILPGVNHVGDIKHGTIRTVFCQLTPKWQNCKKV